MRETKESTENLVKKMLSRDSHSIWEAECGIYSLSQNHERILELIPYKEQMKTAIEGVNLSVPTMDGVKKAFEIINFHENEKECSCKLLGEDDNPEHLAADGYITIFEVKDSGYAWPAHDYFIVECNKCGQKYRVNEQEYHYTWWKWLPISDDETDVKDS